MVVQHFFAEELGRNRIHMLPIRGSRNALALLDAELLKELDVPLIPTHPDEIVVRRRRLLPKRSHRPERDGGCGCGLSRCSGGARRRSVSS